MTDLESRYALARSLTLGTRELALRHGIVRPHWSPDGLWFWYATRIETGVEHVLVDVAAGRQLALFDAAALRQALQAANVQAALDSLAEVRYDPATGGVSFALGGDHWRWHQDQRIERIGRAFAAHEVPAPDGVVAAGLQGANLGLRHSDSDDVTALTDDGEPDFGWGDFTDFISLVTQRQGPVPPMPSVMWSPDSSLMAVLRIDRRGLPQAHLVQAMSGQGVRPVLHSYPFPTPMDEKVGRTELWFIGRDGRRVRAQIDDLACSGFSHFMMGWGRWAADGSHFDLIDADRACKRLTLWRIDSRDGSARRLLQETGPAVVTPSPSIFESPVFHVLRDGTVLWWSQRSGWGHLFVIGADGAARALTEGPWQVRQLLHVDEDAGVVLFTASGRESGVDPYLVFAYRVNLDGTDLRLLTPEMAQHEWILPMPGPGARHVQGLSVAPDGRHFVDNHSTVDRAPRAVLRDAAGAMVMELQQSSMLDARIPGLPLPEPFVVESLDAAALDGAGELWGLLYKPIGFDPGRRYPVIELVYGGPQVAVVPKTWAPAGFGLAAEKLAALGFVVFMLDGPGTPHRSRAFQLASYGRIETCGGLRDHVHALRTLAAERPWMDLDRVGVLGSSGGGYATVRALAEFPDFFKSGVAMCGNHDQSSYIAAWGDCYQGLYEPARYATQDNQSIASRIQGDLLLIHGELDDNVHPAMTLRVVDALIKADRNFEMLIVPGVGHQLGGPLPHVERRIWDFFVRSLMGVEPPRPGKRNPGITS